MTLLPIEPVRERFPGITRAALGIAYDNGGINRERTEEDMCAELGKFLANAQPGHTGLQTIAYINLLAIDQWLQARSADEISVICGGEEMEVRAAMDGAPEGADDLLNEIFEKVG